MVPYGNQILLHVMVCCLTTINHYLPLKVLLYIDNATSPRQVSWAQTSVLSDNRARAESFSSIFFALIYHTVIDLLSKSSSQQAFPRDSSMPISRNWMVCALIIEGKLIWHETSEKLDPAQYIKLFQILRPEKFCGHYWWRPFQYFRYCYTARYLM